MEDSIEWKMLKMCSDRMDLIITSSVTYSKNDCFCSIVIDGLLIAATKGVNLFDTINATSKKAIEKIRKYSKQQHMENGSMCQELRFDLDEKCRRFFPLFEQYMVNFKNCITSDSQLYETPSSGQLYDAPSRQLYDTPSRQLYETPSRQSYETSSGQLYQSQSGQSYQPPSGQSYQPPSGQLYQSPGQLYQPPNNYASPSAPTDWTSASYNPNYYLTKNYTTVTTVKMEPREIKVVSRKMIQEGHNHIDRSNIGFKMLLGLGWSGGPLGANQDGISEPISVELRARRSGLGAGQSNRSTYGNITSDTFFQFLKGYADDDRQYEDLEFANEFSNKEKKKLFGISRELCLLHESEHRNGVLVVKIMKPKYNYH